MNLYNFLLPKISPHLLNNVADFVRSPLANVINASFEQASFVRPAIHRKGSK